MTQIPLPYNGEPPAQSHSPTSVLAADSIKPRIGPMHQRILAFLEGVGPRGATDEEMQLYMDMNPNTQRPRRRELELAGLIVQAAETRQTKSGRAAVVWRRRAV